MICAFERLSLNNLSLNSNMFTRPSYHLSRWKGVLKMAERVLRTRCSWCNRPVLKKIEAVIMKDNCTVVKVCATLERC